MQISHVGAQETLKLHTLRVQEVADGYWVVPVATIGRITEHLVEVVALRSDAHILLTKRSGMILHAVLLLLIISIGLWRWLRHAPWTYKLLRKRDLLELHLVDSSGCGAQQRSGC